MPLTAGSRLAQYEILSPLGAGGMGEVFRARDTVLGRDVALKVLRADAAADARRRQRFQHEARVVASLNHPNIVTIHSVEQSGEQLFLTMELVSGRRVTDLISPGGMPVKTLLNIAVPAADALAAAHAAGVTHRDIKPDNVMVTTSGVVKVLDFGLAKAADAHAVSAGSTVTVPVQTEAGHIAGTPAYMSPEQAEGRAVDGRSDVFSFGVMLYEMATGKRPFTGETPAATIAAILRDTPGPVTDLNPALPNELARVIRRAMAKDPTRRQQSALDLRNELDEIRRELDSGDAPPVAQPTRTATRRPLIAVSALLAILGALAWVAWSNRESSGGAQSNPLTALTVTSLTSEGGTELFPSLSADGKWVVYTRADTASGQTDVVLRAVGGLTTINLTKDSPADDLQPAFSADGERIAFRSERDGGGLFVMGRTGESVQRLTKEGFNPSWSPDGTAIVYATESVSINPGGRIGQSVLRRVDVRTGATHQLTTTDAVQPAWSPHGQRIAFWAFGGAAAQRDLWTIGSDGGEPMRVTDDVAVDWSPAWAADGAYLYYSSNRSGGYAVWRVPIDESSGRVMGDPEAVPVPRSGLAHFSFSKDGRTMAMTSVTVLSNIEALEIEPESLVVERRRRVSNTSENTFTAADRTHRPSLSPDGRWLAYMLPATSGQEDLWVVGTDGSGLRQLTNDAARDRGPQWSPEGSRLLFYSDRGGRMQPWTVAPDGAALRQALDHDGPVIQPIWSSDGTRAMAIDFDSPAALLLFDPRSLPASVADHLQLLGDESFVPWSWSPGAGEVAGYTSPGGQLALLDVKSRSVRTLETPGTVPAWLPDGLRLLYVAGSDLRTGRELRVLDLATGQSRVLFSSPGELLGGPAPSADGRVVYLFITKPEADIVMATFPQPK